MTIAGGAVARRGLLMSACAVSQLGLIREKAMVKRGGEGRGKATISHILRCPGEYEICMCTCIFHNAPLEPRF